MKLSITIALFVVVLMAFSFAEAADECVTGDVKQVECNTCRCLNGSWACTRVGCLKKRAADENCVDGDRKKVDCNTCYCLNGNWGCTKIGCLHKRAIPARFSGIERVKRESCTPGTTSQKECNTCVCTSTGEEICTLKLCL